MAEFVARVVADATTRIQNEIIGCRYQPSDRFGLVVRGGI